MDEIAVTATFTDVTSADHFYKGTYLDAKTFEEEIGVSENCYDALNKILGYDCFVTQYKECWWICRVDEYDGEPFYVSRFDENGEYVNSYVDNNLIKNIGFNETHWLSEEATEVLPTRPIGFAKLTYNFTYPAEIVCNQDFERGVFVEDLPLETIEGLVHEAKRYNLDCWTIGRFYDNKIDPDPTTTEVYLKRLFYNDYEKQRYVVIEPSVVLDPNVYLRSEPIFLNMRDKGTISLDFKYATPQISMNFNTFGLIFFGDSGTSYVTGVGTAGAWIANPFQFPPANPGQINVGDYNFTSEEEKLSFVTKSFEFLGVPEPGNLYIYVEQIRSTDLYISNLQFDYLPFINGSYRAYRGRYDKVERSTTGYLANIDDEVYLSDSQGKLFKGAMFFLADGAYQLTSRWHDASNYALGNPTDLTTVQPYGRHQVYAVWNQYRLSNRVFQYQFQGLGDDIPSLVHKFSVTDVSAHSNNRNFLMLTKEADLFLCSISGTLEQVFHTTELKEYDSPHEFKYIS